jgi:uncharacterized membrane protein
LRRSLFWLILVLGIFLRFHALDRQSLWDDEMSTLQSITLPFGRLPHYFATYETHPPLYFLQLRLWRALDFRSLVKLRANSAVWGSLSLVLAFLLGRLYGGDALGFLTMAFLALSPYHLAYSQEIRPYAMSVAIALAGWLNLERIVGAGHRPRPSLDRTSGRHSGLPLQIFLWTVQLYTHYWGSFVVLAQALYGIWTAPSKSDRKAIVGAFLAASGIFALWLPILFSQLGVIDQLNSWVPAFAFTNLAKVFLPYTGMIFNMATSVFYVHTQVWVLALWSFLFAAALMMGLWRGPRAAVVWLLMGLTIPWILSYWKAPIFLWYRYPIHMFPAFALLACTGLLAVRPRALRIILIVLCLGTQTWGDWTYFSRWQKSNPKAVVAYVHSLRVADMIVIRPSHFAELFNFYDGGTTTTLDEQVLNAPDKRAALKGRKIILLTFDVPSDPVADGLLREFTPVSARYFPGTAHQGITVYELK